MTGQSAPGFPVWVHRGQGARRSAAVADGISIAHPFGSKQSSNRGTSYFEGDSWLIRRFRSQARSDLEGGRPGRLDWTISRIQQNASVGRETIRTVSSMLSSSSTVRAEGLPIRCAGLRRPSGSASMLCCSAGCSDGVWAAAITIVARSARRLRGQVPPSPLARTAGARGTHRAYRGTSRRAGTSEARNCVRTV